MQNPSSPTSGPPSKLEGQEHLEKLRKQVGLDEKAMESASSQILSWRDDDCNASALESLDESLQDPSPFNLHSMSYSLDGMKKIPKSHLVVSDQSEINPFSTPKQKAVFIKDQQQPSGSASMNQNQKTTEWDPIVEKMTFPDLFNVFFKGRRNRQLQREVNQFTQQFEIVACFSLMNFMRDGLIRDDFETADKQIMAYLAGFSVGLSHANQTSIEKSIMSLDVLVKQTQHYLEGHRDVIETLHQNTDVLQRNVQKSLSEMGKWKELPDKLSDLLDSARSQYDTPRGLPSSNLDYVQKSPVQTTPNYPVEIDQVITIIWDRRVKICKEVDGKERVVKMSAQNKSYFDERPHIIRKLKSMPWNMIQTCNNQDISAYFPEEGNA